MHRWFRYVLIHWPQLLVLPGMAAIGVTFLHEAAHALMALALGGSVSGLQIVPGNGVLGQVHTRLPPSAPWFGNALVTVAPYLMWAGLIAIVTAIALLPRQRLHPYLGSTLWLWGFVVPLGDIAWNLGSGDLYLRGPDGDLLVAIGLVLIAMTWTVGFPVQRSLYKEDGLGLGAYVAGSAVLGTLWLIVA